LNISLNGAELMGLVEITWSAVDADDDNISISLFIKRDSEDAWEPLVQEFPNESPFIWNSSTVPDGTGYRFRLIATDDSSDMLNGTAETNASYSIYNPDPPEVTNLSIGSQDPLSGVVQVSWNIYDPDGDDVMIALQWRRDNGEWTNVTHGQLGPQAWEWDTTDVPDGSEYELRVVATDSSQFTLKGTMVSDTFTIYNPDPPFVKVISPGGGDVLEGVVTITWNATDADNETLLVDVEYFSADEEWTVLVEDAISIESFAWDTTSVPDGAGYVIRITVRDISEFALTTFDVSDSFRIDNPDEPVITFLSPLLDVPLSGVVEITWNAEDADGDQLFISIQLSRDGVIWYEIASGEVNDGSFIWDTGTVSNGEYHIKITANDGSLEGEDKLAGMMIKNTPPTSDKRSSFIILSVLVVIPLILSVLVFLVFARRKRKPKVVEEIAAPGDTLEEIEEAIVLVDTSTALEDVVILESTSGEEPSFEGPDQLAGTSFGLKPPQKAIKKRVVMRKTAGKKDDR